MLNIKTFVYSFLVLLYISSCGKTPADLVLRNGKIATVDENFTIAEAVAITGDIITFVGSNADVEDYIGDLTRIIDLEGKLAIPGLIDAHVHLPDFGASLDDLNFVGTTSFQQVVDLIAEKAKTVDDGEWILGRGWDQNDWQDKQFPLHDALSAVSPNNPVWLDRVDMHAAIANAKALEIAGISPGMPDPEGGKIHWKSDGTPTGVFVDNAKSFVVSKIPPMSTGKRRETLIKAAEACLAVGLTGVHDAGVSLEIIEDYKYLVNEDRFHLRMYAMLEYPADEDDLETYLSQNKIINYGDMNFLTVRSMKMVIDGALGSRGAALIEDYSDDPGNTGLILTSAEKILEAARAGLAAGVQINTHAIGDLGNRILLDAYETALGENPTADHRFRNEHAQIVALDDIPRFAQLGILPSMQPTHATSDMYWAEERVGEDRIQGGYAWQSFIRSGLKVPFGSDFPVESVNPLLGFYAAVTRQDAQEWPEGGWMPDQRVTREQALRGFTIWAAYAAFQEDLVGSIEVGKLADIVVLSGDILEISPKDILATVPVYTIVDGRIRFSQVR